MVSDHLLHDLPEQGRNQLRVQIPLLTELSQTGQLFGLPGAIKATCSCGNVIETQSTLGKDILIDVCSQCHPFYTGKQKILDSGGRVDRFKKRFGNRRV